MNAPFQLPEIPHDASKPCVVCAKLHREMCSRIKSITFDKAGTFTVELRELTTATGTRWERFKGGLSAESVGKAAGSMLGWLVGIAMFVIGIKVANLLWP